MPNKTKWLWALRDKDKAMKTMGISPVKQEEKPPLPTVESNPKASKRAATTLTKEPKRKGFLRTDDYSEDQNDRTATDIRSRRSTGTQRIKILLQ